LDIVSGLITSKLNRRVAIVIGVPQSFRLEQFSSKPQSYRNLPMQPEPWHQMSIANVLSTLETNPERGLAGSEVSDRQQRCGANALTPKEGKGAIIVFLEQFNQPLVYILLASAAITTLLRDWVEMGVIIAVVLINAFIGFIQEVKAAKAMEALLQGMQSDATVLREGQKQQIRATELVPGDIVFLQSGDKVPADLRLVRSRDLQVAESSLTGESTSVEKQSLDQLDPDTLLADRVNMAYSTTLVTYGTATGVVVAIGDKTQIGQINELLNSADELSTPLTQQIKQFSLGLMNVILALGGLALVAGLIRQYSLEETFLSVVALAVGAIPEGLPAAVTITLAIGVARMAQRHAIIRKLPAVETLGSTTVICSDKTGTLTQNEMTVQEIYAGGAGVTVSGIGYAPEGNLTQAQTEIQPKDHPALLECLRAGLLCNDSRLNPTETGWKIEGDPTEAALITVARKAGLDRSIEDQAYPRIDTIPFESEHQYMATLHRSEGATLVYVKGSVEAILPRCRDGYQAADQRTPLDEAAIHQQVDQMAAKGLRVLAFACVSQPLELRDITHDSVAQGLTFIGLQGMIDPARAEAIDAVRACQRAGIKVKMITGDHVGTAAAIGRKFGLAGTEGTYGKTIAISGRDIEALSDQELIGVADRIPVFARVAPEQKLRLVKALQARGHVVAMTGDGVNDGPALRQSDIGIAMGITGTEVAKEAADMVLTDDNFATIEAAVEEGRGVYDNILKFIVWTLPTNASLGLIILVSLFFNVPLPVLPLQVLWVNTTTVVFLGTMLAFEVKEPGLMQRSPRPPHTPLLKRSSVQRVLWVGIFLCAAAFAVYALERYDDEAAATARTAAVNTIVFGEIFLLFACRSLRVSMFKLGVFSNPLLWLGVIVMTIAQLLFTYAPLMNRIFKTAAIGSGEWTVILLSSLLLYLLFELDKWLRRRAERSKA
jgi:potassium/sodium efflux P-type ATPase